VVEADIQFLALLLELFGAAATLPRIYKICCLKFGELTPDKHHRNVVRQGRKDQYFDDAMKRILVLDLASARSLDAPAFWPRNRGYQSQIGRQITK
jgi:hypothetical protein